MLGSTVLGGVMTIWGQSIKAKAEQNKMLLQRAEFRAGAVKAARGFVITPLDTHIVSAIVGLYFGAGFTK